jgi:hypothetical protein
LDQHLHRAVRRANSQPAKDGGSRHRPWLLLLSLGLLALAVMLLLSRDPPHSRATIALLGDINLARGVQPAAASFDFLEPELEAAGLALANLESPLVASPPAAADEYNLCAPADRASHLAGWGLDLLSIANNHRTDCGRDGIPNTASALTKVGITPIGANPQPVERTVNGLRLAFLAFDDVTSPLDVQAAARSIHSAQAGGATVIVSVHWGMEYQSGASERQKSLATKFAQAGAAVVWGHHPHVLQPVEWIDTPPGRTLVLYSLGNTLFDQPGLADTRESALLLLEIDSRGVQGLRAVPFLINIQSSRVMLPDEQTAARILERLKIE